MPETSTTKPELITIQIDPRLQLSNLALNGHGKRAKRAQILVMQRALFLDVVKSETDPKDQASCARAYDVLEDRVRIIDGELKPGSYNAHSREPMPDKRKSRRAGGPVGKTSSPRGTNDKCKDGFTGVDTPPLASPVQYALPGESSAPAVVRDDGVTNSPPLAPGESAA